MMSHCNPEERMPAEVISIGDELTSGQRLDTNSQWLSQRLGEIGVGVLYHSTVGDDLPANIRVFREAIERADLIVATGGLGPTADDLTRQALADAVGLPVVQDEAALEHIRELFARRKREMPPANIVQAQFPQGSRVVPNPNGSAPGIDLTVERAGQAGSLSNARIFCLPGVPAEMREMWTATVGPAIAAMQPEPRLIRHKQIKCFGVGESDLEAMLPDLIARKREPLVGITVSKATITLRITASGRTSEECDAAMQPTIDTIHQCLGDLVFGYDDDEVQHAVVRLLAANNQTLATVECGTGGLVAHWLSEVDGSDQVYRGGQVLSRDGLNANHDRRSVIGLLKQVRSMFASDYVLFIGPFPDSPDGDVQLALVSADDVISLTTPFTGHPDILKARIAKSGLNLVRRSIRSRE
jgi:nicotinamide-nucleotide amidase